MDSRPDTFGITEIKLNEFSITNLDLNSYSIFRTDSKSNRWFSRYVIAAMLVDEKKKISN